MWGSALLDGPRLKTCFRGFRQNETQTSLLSFRDLLENENMVVADVQAYLSLCCSQTLKAGFSHVEAQLILKRLKPWAMFYHQNCDFSTIKIHLYKIA